MVVKTDPGDVVDKELDVSVAMGEIHHQIHLGKLHKVATIIEVADAASGGLYLRVGPDQDLHGIWSIAATGKARIKIYGGVSPSVSGTGIEPINLNGAMQ